MYDTIRAVVLGVVAILAVVYAAVTLDGAVVQDRDTGNGGSGENGASIPPAPIETAPVGTIDIPFLTDVLTVIFVLGLLTLIILILLYWRTTLGVTIAVIAVIALIYLVLQVLPLSPSMPEPVNGGADMPGDNGENGDPTTPTVPLIPSWLLVIVAGVIGGIGVLYLFFSKQRRSEVIRDRSHTDTTDIADAAGRAADRIEATTDFDNEVYRAWDEMTAMLDVREPKTCTPGEFAAAAIAIGMKQADVDELTRLFEDVRYGENRATETTEQQALDILRRIERTYSQSEDTP